MANPSPLFQLTAVLLLFIASAAAAGISTTTNSQEVISALEALRDNDYTLFANAITTSDLQYQLFTAAATPVGHGPISSFTLFAPKDDQIFALDMATDAAVYVNTLRYHFVPNHRHTYADLQNLSSPFLQTLLPHHSLLIGKVLEGDDPFDNAAVGVAVDGVRILTPDIFVGSRISVHGVDGILLTGLKEHADTANGTSSGADSPESPPVVPEYPPVAPAPKMEVQPEKLKSLAMRKRGRRHREGRRHHRGDIPVGGHHLRDL